MLCTSLLTNNCFYIFSNWEVETCLKNSGQTVVGSSDWYVDWTLNKCVQDCDDNDSSSNCGKTVSTIYFLRNKMRRSSSQFFFVQLFFYEGGLASSWDPLYADSSDCCKRLWWLDEDKDCTD